MNAQQQYQHYMNQYEGHLQRWLGSRNYPPHHRQDLQQEARLAIWKRRTKDEALFTENTEAYVITAAYYGLRNNQVKLQKWDDTNKEMDEAFWDSQHTTARDPRAAKDFNIVDTRRDLQICWDRMTEHMPDDQAATCKQILELWSYGHPLRHIAKLLNKPYADVRRTFDDTINNFREHWPDPEAVMPDEIQWRQTHRKRNKQPSYRHGRYEVKLQLPGQEPLRTIVFTKVEVQKFLSKHTGVGRKRSQNIINSRADTEWHSQNPKFQLIVKYIK